jgi:hypothetical protein
VSVTAADVLGGQMRAFEYVAVLLSIIISFAFAHLLNGIAHIIEYGIKRFSLLLAHWIVWCLFLCVDYWFTIWHARDTTVWTLGYVSLLLTQGALIYIAARLVVPVPTKDEPVDLSAFFDSHRRKFMGAIVLLALVNEATNLTLAGFNTSRLGWLIVGWVLLFSAAFVWEDKHLQYAVAATNVVMTVYYAATFVPAL